MKITRKVIGLIVLIAVIGCGEQEQQKTEAALLKTQVDALNQAKQVESLLQKSADLQEQQINAQTQAASK